MTTLTRKALTFAEIEQYLHDCTTQLLEAYQRPVEAVDGRADEVPGPSVMSVVGFAAAELRGAIVLVSPRDVVVRLVPPELDRSAVPVEHLLRDVLGEFANMLAGRLRNRLIAHGIDPMVSMPTTMLGDEIVVPAPRSGMSAWQRFEGRGLQLSVRLDATFDAAFALAAPEAHMAPSLREGEMVLF